MLAFPKIFWKKSYPQCSSRSNSQSWWSPGVEFTLLPFMNIPLESSAVSFKDTLTAKSISLWIYQNILFIQQNHFIHYEVYLMVHFEIKMWISFSDKLCPPNYSCNFKCFIDLWIPISRNKVEESSVCGSLNSVQS